MSENNRKPVIKHITGYFDMTSPFITSAMRVTKEGVAKKKKSYFILQNQQLPVSAVINKLLNEITNHANKFYRMNLILHSPSLLPLCTDTTNDIQRTTFLLCLP
jgi:hypothetical protein